MVPLQQVHFEDSGDTRKDRPMKRSTRSSIASNYTMASTLTNTSMDNDDEWTIDVQSETGPAGFFASVVQKLFPYHIVINQYFQITSVGDQLSRIMNCQAREQLLGQHVDSIFSIRMPSEGEWSWDWLTAQGMEDFRLAPVMTSPHVNMLLRFKANIVQATAEQVMINMIPDANTAKDLSDMDLTVQDMPSHGGYRRALELQSRIDDISRTESSRRQATANLCGNLTKEKELLESLVPKHVAQGLRLGENVAPRQHERVTFFFSDVVGFTDMCKQLYPWQVCGMLNRLYCVMDYLLDKFGLFKVETIGDAYVCCSGIPEPDRDHAEKVANFAIAVSHCVKHVLSPVDGKPIQLRIGVHTGSAASGVVGVNNPRYCVFGDTVNVTARHESSGAPGRVHCSAVTKKILATEYEDDFHCISRGMVDMKGKGALKTYWLESSESNQHVNRVGMSQLEMLTDELLQQTKFDSELEKQTQEKSLQLAGKLGKAQMSAEHQKVMGPVLDIIRRELTCKNQMNVSMHSTGSSVNSGDRRSSLSKSKSWDTPDAEQAKTLEKHFGKSDRGYVYTRSPTKRTVPKRAKSLEDVQDAMAFVHARDQDDASITSTQSDSLVGMVSQGRSEICKPSKRRGGRRSKKASVLPKLPPVQLFDILERALDEFDDDF